MAGLAAASVPAVAAPTDVIRPGSGRSPAGADLGRMVQTTWADLKELLGFTNQCFNGGTRVAGGGCRCPALFTGSQCETIQCLNNGTRVAIAKLKPTQYHCKCPFPEFVTGAHCESLSCANGGRLTANASCECPDWYYEGRFCEHFAASWLVVLIPIICILIFLLCCLICRMDLCPRRRPPPPRAQPNSRSRRRPVASAESRRVDGRQRGERAERVPLSAERDLLGEERVCVRGPAYPTGVVAPYVIRLDTIPTFNPDMIGGVPVSDDDKDFEPPPSYEQALSAAVAPPTSAPPSRPPDYSPGMGPPTTSRMVPPPPRLPPPPPPP